MQRLKQIECALGYSIDHSNEIVRLTTNYDLVIHTLTYLNKKQGETLRVHIPLTGRLPMHDFSAIDSYKDGRPVKENYSHTPPYSPSLKPPRFERRAGPGGS